MFRCTRRGLLLSLVGGLFCLALLSVVVWLVTTTLTIEDFLLPLQPKVKPCPPPPKPEIPVISDEAVASVCELWKTPQLPPVGLYRRPGQRLPTCQTGLPPPFTLDGTGELHI